MSTSKIDAWSTASLLDCADFVRGVTYTKSDAYTESNQNLVPLLRANNLQAGSFDLNDLVYVNKNIPSEQQILKQGDVVIATSSGSLSVVGKAVQFFENEKLTFGAFCGVLRPSKIVDLRYFGHFFKSQAYRAAVSNLARGVNINNLKKDHFAEIQIPIAPIEEQRRIADKLDTTLARVDALNDRLARITPLLKRFRQSVLAAATSGRLTEDWRDGVGEWREVKISDIGVLGRGKSRHRPRNDPALYGGVHPFIQTGDVANAGEYIVSHSQTYSELGLLQSKLWPANTLCITIAANIADTAILSYPACFPDSIVGFVANEKICRVKYVKWFIDSIKDRLEQFAPATAQKNINLAVLEDIKIKLPTLDEQTEIVRRVETLFAFADRLQDRLQSAQTAAERLTPALLAKAFRGELVPQDPNDEPAAELLRRLRAARAADTASKPKRGRAAKASTVSE